MEHEFNLKAHLQSMAAIFAIIGTIASGMIASMMMLVIDGIWVATSDTVIAGNDFGGHYGRILPLTLLSFVILEFMTLRFYLKYAARVRKDPSQRFEF